ncbi:hypothetical protein LTS18_001686 [Coniosporium uncinatum]|uniref:Uncharacterized protein n=1 Tax=Coniosporium uncinatum TaxID=93489 RepID=A0ACC3D8I0_9PEZI|nr:hypothetical protein LTS18_001686 [Coniosporium uncinatum]
MQPLGRRAALSARSVKPLLRQPARRYAQHTTPATHDAAQGAQHHHPVEENEHFGTGFWITVAAIPATLALYQYGGFARGEQPWLTRVIKDNYDHLNETWKARNKLHTDMIEQAAADRQLFLNSKGSTHVELKFPETFNVGSPYNVPAGHGGANIERVVAHYEKLAYEENARKLQAMKDGTLKPIQNVKADPTIGGAKHL